MPWEGTASPCTASGLKQSLLPGGAVLEVGEFHPEGLAGVTSGGILEFLPFRGQLALEFGGKAKLALFDLGGLGDKVLFADGESLPGGFGSLPQFALDGGAMLLEHGVVERERLGAMRAGDQRIGGGRHGSGD
jgi:hypothetical protein